MHNTKSETSIHSLMYGHILALIHSPPHDDVLNSGAAGFVGLVKCQAELGLGGVIFTSGSENTFSYALMYFYLF